MIKAVIIEDDLMVASINNQFLLKTPGIQTTATFHSGKSALAFLKENPVDLILLDLYMPDLSGLELLSELRRQNRKEDVIMITAANDAEHISEALHLGIIDYLVKPFTYERFSQAVDKFLLQRKIIENGMAFSQNDIDQLIHMTRPSQTSREMELEKGIQRQTLEKLRNCLKQCPGQYKTSEQISEETGLSKVTIRRYMNYLIEHDAAKSRIDYETGGRPRIEYLLTRSTL